MNSFSSILIYSFTLDLYLSFENNEKSIKYGECFVKYLILNVRNNLTTEVYFLDDLLVNLSK